jgi:hypothetical protein
MGTPTQEFFDQLDELPTRRAGGFVIAVGEATGRRLPSHERPATAEYRSRVPRWRRECERRKRCLELLGYLIELEERNE